MENYVVARMQVSLTKSAYWEGRAVLFYNCLVFEIFLTVLPTIHGAILTKTS
jgi:hypothetical protein